MRVSNKVYEYSLSHMGGGVKPGRPEWHFALNLENDQRCKISKALTVREA